MAFFAIAQKSFQLTGSIKDSITNAGLTDAIIIVTINGKQFYAIADSVGDFTAKCTLKDSLSDLSSTILIRLIGYADKEQKVVLKNEITVLPDIFLQSKSTYLSEVIVRAKPIEKIGDTTIFSVSAFKNKLDENLEDVLKKMPGMDVDESGNIKYNNRPIENIMIEGDVLSKNYKLISKNITPDMVDKVQMIDKYNSNPVLKDLTSSQKQTMNLVLKNPKKLKSFGTVKAGVGVKDKLNITGSLFVFNNRVKTMAIINKNNIGVSPYSEYSVDQEYAQATEYEFAQTILPNYITENTLFGQSYFGTNTNSLFNNSNLAVFNNNVRLNKNTTFKLFTDVYKDKIDQYQTAVNQNNLYPQLSYNETTQKKFLPINFNGNSEFNYSNKRSRLLINAAFTSKRYNEQNTVLSFSNFTNQLSSTFKRSAIAAYYTYRIDSSKALEASYQYISDRESQSFILAQDQYRFLDSTYLTNYQAVQTYNKINSEIAEIKFLFKNKRASQLSLKNSHYMSVYNAAMNIKDNAGISFNVSDYMDTTNIISDDLLLNYNTGYKFKRFSVVADIGVLWNNYKNKNAGLKGQSFQQVYPTPKLNFSYSISGHQQISATFGLDAENPSLKSTYLHSLLIGYRSVQRNAAIVPAIKSVKYGLNYSYTNLEKATSLLLSYYHAAQLKSEVTNFIFTKDFDYYQNSYQNISQNFNNIYLKFDRYIYPLNTAIGIKHTLAWFNDPIEVNGVLSSNKFFTYNAVLSIRPTIDKNINFNTGLDYKFNKDLASQEKTFQLNPYIDLMFTANKRFSIGGRCNYFYSNYAIQKKNYFFGNVYGWYTIKPRKIDAKFSVYNVLNTDATLSGYSTSALTRGVTTKLLPRYAMLEFSFKF